MSKQRSKRLTSHKILGVTLCQWNYSQRTESYIMCGFRSLVRKEGRWHLDLPYFCYGGVHRYRALPRALSAYVTLRVTLGNTKRSFDGIARTVGYRMRSAFVGVLAAAPGIRRYRRWQADRSLRKFLGL